MHTNYKPAKPGVYAEQIASAKERAIDATLANPDSKAVVMTALYGSTKTIAHQAVHARFGSWVATAQMLGLRYSDRGDFTRCYRGGF